MTRDYVNYKRKQQRRNKKAGVWFLLFFFCAVLIGLSFYGYKQGLLARLQPPARTTLATYFSNFFHPASGHHPASKKLAVSAAETIKPIHFDFYDELPKTEVEEDLIPEEAPPTVVKKTQVVQEVAAEPAASLYILQLGEFHSLPAAKRYRQALSAAGLSVDLVKVRLGREWAYRLQQGPFHSVEQLKLAKKRLSARGIACDIHKLPQYVM